MKKIMGVIVALLLVFAVVSFATGCGGSPAPAATQEPVAEQAEVEDGADGEEVSESAEAEGE